MFLKVPVIIIIRFGANNVLWQILINIYIGDGLGGGACKWFILHSAFIIHENGKIIRI